jgi:hypothetical protein
MEAMLALTLGAAQNKCGVGRNKADRIVVLLEQKDT